MTLPVPAPPPLAAEIDALARRHRRANGPVMSLVTRLGGTVERQLDQIPDSLRDRLEQVVAAALSGAWEVAARGPALTGHRPSLAVAATGAAGGAGGMATALAELPVTVTLMLAAIRAEAVAAGFDPDEPAIRAECLGVFAAGSPLAGDDGINTAFLSARMAMTGGTVQTIIATVAPRLAAVLGQKLAAQAVPLVGALSGAALNLAFVAYYREVARIRFALLRLSVQHGAEPVLAAFRAAAEAPALRRAGG